MPTMESDLRLSTGSKNTPTPLHEAGVDEKFVGLSDAYPTATVT